MKATAGQIEQSGKRVEKFHFGDWVWLLRQKGSRRCKSPCVLPQDAKNEICEHVTKKMAYITTAVVFCRDWQVMAAIPRNGTRYRETLLLLRQTQVDTSAS